MIRRRVRLVAALCAVMALSIISVPALAVSQSAALTAHKIPITWHFVSPQMEVGAKGTFAEICGVRATRGSMVSLDEQFGTKRVWRAVFKRSILGSRCVDAPIHSTVRGQYAFRVSLTKLGHPTYISADQRLTVYGPVNFLSLCSSVRGCQLINGGNSNTIEIGGHVVSFFDVGCPQNYQTWAPNGCGAIDNELPTGYDFTAKNSCRSLTLTTAFEDQQGTETPGDAITIQVLQGTLNAQSYQVPYDQVETATFALDGSPANIDFTESTGNEKLYVLSGTADCWTTNGAL